MLRTIYKRCIISKTQIRRPKEIFINMITNKLIFHLKPFNGFMHL